MAKPRPRCECRPGGKGKGVRCHGCGRNIPVFPSVYQPTAAAKWEKAVALALVAAWRRPNLQGCVRVEIDMVWSRPGGRPNRVPALMWKLGCRVPKGTKPDGDNCEKAVLDAINQAGVWEDDAQVSSCTWRCWYAAKGGEPGISLLVEEV